MSVFLYFGGLGYVAGGAFLFGVADGADLKQSDEAQDGQEDPGEYAGPALDDVDHVPGDQCKGEKKRNDAFGHVFRHFVYLHAVFAASCFHHFGSVSPAALSEGGLSTGHSLIRLSKGSGSCSSAFFLSFFARLLSIAA